MITIYWLIYSAFDITAEIFLDLFLCHVIVGKYTVYLLLKMESKL